MPIVQESSIYRLDSDQNPKSFGQGVLFLEVGGSREEAGIALPLCEGCGLAANSILRNSRAVFGQSSFISPTLKSGCRDENYWFHHHFAKVLLLFVRTEALLPSPADNA